MQAAGYDLGDLPEGPEALEGLGEALLKTLKGQEEPRTVSRGAQGVGGPPLPISCSCLPAVDVLCCCRNRQHRQLDTAVQLSQFSKGNFMCTVSAAAGTRHSLIWQKYTATYGNFPMANGRMAECEFFYQS